VTGVNIYDKWLLLATMVLAGFGALMIYSSTSVLASVKGVSEFYYFKKHVFALGLGMAAMFLASRTRPSNMMRVAVPLLVLSFCLILLVFVPSIGVSAGGARRWIRLWPTVFQPSELVKLAMVVFLARYLCRIDAKSSRFVHYLLPIGVMAVFQLVFIKQPDFGATMSLGMITMGMLFAAGMRLRYLGVLLLLFVPVAVKLVMEPYRVKRLTAFLDPWRHQHDSGFQLVQSFIALGSGGLTGVGLGQSRQKLAFLPEVHTDFIFSMVGEELGFVVAVVIVALFALIFVRGIMIAGKSQDKFSYYLAIGLSMMLAFQSLVNFGVVTGMLPTKGLPLPFLSYGGSSLLVNLVAVGILLSLSRPVAEGEPRSDDLSELLKRKKARRAVYGEAD